MSNKVLRCFLPHSPNWNTGSGGGIWLFNLFSASEMNCNFSQAPPHFSIDFGIWSIWKWKEGGEKTDQNRSLKTNWSIKTGSLGWVYFGLWVTMGAAVVLTDVSSGGMCILVHDHLPKLQLIMNCWVQAQADHDHFERAPKDERRDAPIRYVNVRVMDTKSVRGRWHLFRRRRRWDLRPQKEF